VHEKERERASERTSERERGRRRGGNRGGSPRVIAISSVVAVPDLDRATRDARSILPTICVLCRSAGRSEVAVSCANDHRSDRCGNVPTGLTLRFPRNPEACDLFVRDQILERGQEHT